MALYGKHPYPSRRQYIYDRHAPSYKCGERVFRPLLVTFCFCLRWWLARLLFSPPSARKQLAPPYPRQTTCPLSRAPPVGLVDGG